MARSREQVLRAITNPRRRAILAMLWRGERLVGDIAREFDVSRPAVSRHLRVLREAKLVRVRVEHNAHWYSVAHEQLAGFERELFAEEFEGLWGPRGTAGRARPRVKHRRRPAVEVSVSVLLHVSRRVAYGYFTDLRLHREWLGEYSHASPEVGGIFEADSAAGGRVKGEHIAMVPNRLIVNRIDDPLREENVCLVHFRDEKKGTRVEIRHYLCDLEVANVVEDAWIQALGQLRTVVNRRGRKKN